MISYDPLFFFLPNETIHIYFSGKEQQSSKEETKIIIFLVEKIWEQEMAVIRLTTTETETTRLSSVSRAQMPPLRNPAHRLLIGQLF